MSKDIGKLPRESASRSQDVDFGEQLWQVAVFAHNEELQIGACLESLDEASASHSINVYVMANGCSDRTEAVFREFAQTRRWLTLVSLALPDKANAWNVFVHDVAPPAYAQNVGTAENSPVTITLTGNTQNPQVPQQQLEYVFPPSHEPSAAAQNILFIGNSEISYYWDMPSVVQSLAVSAGLPAPNVTEDLADGSGLNVFVGNAPTTSLIQSGYNGQPWNYVVLNELSYGPTDAGNPAQFKADAAWLYNEIEQYNPKATVVLFETPAYSPDYGWYDYLANGTTPGAGTFVNIDDMQSQLRENYLDAAYSYIPANSAAAVTNQVEVARCGDAFATYFDDTNSEDLWQDGKHPSYKGTYLNALVMFETIYGRSVVGLPFYDNYDAATATFLENIAATVAPLPSGPSHGTLTFVSNNVWQYTPAPNYSGPDSFQFMAFDSQAGPPATCLCSTPATVSITVQQPNQPPVGTSHTATTLENVPYAFGVSDFGFSDPNTPPNNFLAVKVTTLPTAGTITDNGTAVTAGQFVSVADVTAGELCRPPPRYHRVALAAQVRANGFLAFDAGEQMARQGRRPAAARSHPIQAGQRPIQ